MGALADAKREWKQVYHDVPGERFCHHRERMLSRPRWHSYIALGAGVVTIAAGVVLLFIPGPGTVFIVVGLGLVASHSARLAGWLDHSEPRLRGWFHRMKTVVTVWRRNR